MSLSGGALILPSWFVCNLFEHVSQVWVVLENVAKRPTADVLSQQLHRLGYVCQCIMANSCSFGVPQSRTRLYLMAIDPLQAEVTQPPERWVRLLQVTDQVR